MKTVFLFFITNIIAFVASFSAMGTDTITGYIISYIVWALFLMHLLKPFKKK